MTHENISFRNNYFDYRQYINGWQMEIRPDKLNVVQWVLTGEDILTLEIMEVTEYGRNIFETNFIFIDYHYDGLICQ